MNWLQKIFGDQKKVINQDKMAQIDYVQITTDWNAHPVSPEIQLQIKGSNLLMSIFVNACVFEGFKDGDKANVLFRNCSKYSLNRCNDEGYYYRQYRTNQSELPWGEFYEIKAGLNRDFPEPVVQLKVDTSNKRHFIFFFKDEIFECLTDDYEIEFSLSISNSPTEIPS